MSNIVALIVTTGEEIIGSLKESLEHTEVYVIEQPRVVALMRSPDGQQGLGLVPWLKANMNGTVEINKAQVITKPYVVVAEVKNAYLQETTGLQIASQMPQKGGIIQ